MRHITGDSLSPSCPVQCSETFRKAATPTKGRGPGVCVRVCVHVCREKRGRHVCKEESV